jgi:predicted dinucleotide-binding enzyme
MATGKTIAIVGATEKMGAAVAKNLSSGNYRLLLMAEDIEELESLRAELEGAKAEIIIHQCAKDACWEADIIVLATPYENFRKVAEKIRDVATGKIVVSISNTLNERYTELVSSPNTSAAEELQKMLPYSKVIKTFNTSLAAKFISPPVLGDNADAFIAGNNGVAVVTVFELLQSIGYNPIVAGDLSVSRMLERMQWLLNMPGSKENFEQLKATFN